MLAHLGEDGLGHVLAATDKDVAHVLVPAETAAEMRHHLPGEIVEQGGVLLIVDLVEVD